MNKRMVSVIVAFFMLLATFVPRSVAAMPEYEITNYTLVIDNEPQELAKPILLSNGRSMLPMRSFFESLGATVTWDGETRTATATKGEFVVAFPIGANDILVNGKKTWIDVPAMLVADSTYVPVRAAAESLGYGVTFDNGVVTLTTGGQSDSQSVLANVDYSGQTFDRSWYAADREHLASLIEKGDKSGLKRLVYSEYVGLSKEMARLYDSAYHSQRGYILFTPTLTDSINAVWMGMMARTKLLEDLLKDHVQGIDAYYPATFTYQFLRHRAGEMSKEVTPTASFPGFDQADVTTFLDGLDVPDYYLTGTKVYFVAGKPNATEAGVNYNTSSRGFFDTSVVIFNWGQNVRDIRGVVAHEIGHNIGSELLYDWPLSPVKTSPDTAVQQEYAGLYGEAVPNWAVPWGDSITENFADDFAYSHLDYYQKLSNWRGVSRDDVRDFINGRIAEKDISNVVTCTSMTIELDAGEIPLLGDVTWTPDNNGHYLVTGKAEATLHFDGLTGSVYASINGTLHKFNGATVTLPLPSADSLYTVEIGTSPDGKHLNTILFGSLYLLRVKQ